MSRTETVIVDEVAQVRGVKRRDVRKYFARDVAKLYRWATQANGHLEGMSPADLRTLVRGEARLIADEDHV